jgi:hypothetical protein
MPLGRAVRCSWCGITFRIGDGDRPPVRPAPPAARREPVPASVPRARRREESRRDDDEDDRDRDDDERPHRRKKRRAKQSPGVNPAVVAVVVIGSILLCGVIGGIIYYVASGDRSSAVTQNTPTRPLLFGAPSEEPGYRPEPPYRPEPEPPNQPPPVVGEPTRPVVIRHPEQEPPATPPPPVAGGGSLPPDVLKRVKRATVYVKVVQGNGRASTGTGFFGVRTRNGREEAVIDLSGALRTGRGRQSPLTGKARRIACVDLATGRLAHARATVDLSVDIPLDDEEGVLRATGTLEVRLDRHLGPPR